MLYADRVLAHADAQPIPAESLVTYDQLDAAIVEIGRVFKKYATLLTGQGYVTLVPVIQDDWLAIFREPWIKPES